MTQIEVGGSDLKWQLIIEGKPIQGHYTFDIATARQGNFNLQLLDAWAFNTISKLTVKDLAHALKSIESGPTGVKFGPAEVVVNIFFSSSPLNAQVRLLINIEDWKEPWSLSEYRSEFYQKAKNYPILDIDWDAYRYGATLSKQISRPLEFYFSSLDPSNTFAQIVEYAASILSKIHEDTIDTLSAHVHSHSIVARFDFPSEVAVPCEQYLLYFVQFLKDIGVEATANINHSAGGVLFSVTPDDKDVALDNIREALSVYLKLPSNPGIGTGIVLSADVETQRLTASVQYLQMQLGLANAVLQTKDATIQAQQVTIQGQQAQMTQYRLIGTDVMADSFRPIDNWPTDKTTKPGDIEPILGGTFDVKPVDLKFVNFNLPHVIRYLRDMFVQKKRDSVDRREALPSPKEIDNTIDA